MVKKTIFKCGIFRRFRFPSPSAELGNLLPPFRRVVARPITSTRGVFTGFQANLSFPHGGFSFLHSRNTMPSVDSSMITMSVDIPKTFGAVLLGSLFASV